MNHPQELLIVTANSFVHAYGGVLYLADALWQRGIKVRVLGHVQREYAHLIPQKPYPLVNLAQLPFGRIPKIRGLVKMARILSEGLRPNTHWLFNDFGFFHEAIILKRLRPQRRLIHYTTELLTPEEQPAIGNRLRFYERHAGEVDLVIDVEPHRAARRMERFGLPRLPLVLPNTLPAADFPPPGPPGSLARLAGGPLPTDRFILLYAGSAHPSMSFDRLLQAIALCPIPVFLLGFVRGDADRLADWRRQLDAKLGPAGGRICSAVPRIDLLRAISEAGAGLIYYPPSDEPSSNQLFCAPTKLYEYLAAGLPVVGSANPSLRDLLEPAELGYCADEDSPAGLARALERTVVQCGSRAVDHRLHAQTYFRDRLCFERTNEPVLSSIINMIVSTPDGDRTVS